MDDRTPFERLAANFRSGSSETHVWLVPICPPVGAGLRLYLSLEEARRADRFVFESDRDRYIGAHAALRKVLSACTGIDTADLEFEAGERGKPRLSTRTPIPLHFNLSHSGDYALVGVARRPLGVDIEAVRAGVDHMNIARAYFTADEIVRIAGVEEADQLQRFYRVWTVKEAFLKATGTGLSSPLNTVSTRLGPWPKARLHGTDGSEFSDWCAEELEVPDGYAAAVVQGAPAATIRLATFGDS